MPGSLPQRQLQRSMLYIKNTRICSVAGEASVVQVISNRLGEVLGGPRGHDDDMQAQSSVVQSQAIVAVPEASSFFCAKRSYYLGETAQ